MSHDTYHDRVLLSVSLLSGLISDKYATLLSPPDELEPTLFKELAVLFIKHSREEAQNRSTVSTHLRVETYVRDFLKKISNRMVLVKYSPPSQSHVQIHTFSCARSHTG